MIKKIIHIADYHLRTFKRHDEYREQTLKFFETIMDLLKDYKREEIRLVIVGDLVHQKINVSNEQFAFLAWFLRSCADLYPTIIVAGNHDLLENNKDRMDSISPVVELLNHKDLQFFKESKCYLDENIVWCNYSIFEDNKRPIDYEEYYKNHSSNKKFVGLYHGPLNGSSTDLGFNVEGEELDVFEGLDYVLCGDIHKRNHLKLEF